MLEPIQNAPANVLALRAVGKIEDGDYKSVLIPAVELQIKTFGKVRLVYELGSEFEGFSAKAALDDALLGLDHWQDFERIAIVTDRTWIADALRLFLPLLPAKSKLFTTDHRQAALDWAGA